MRYFKFLGVSLMVVLVLGCLVRQVNAQQKRETQKPSRAEAIARIAASFPNSHKSPEQAYDEGQIRETARAFAKRFRSRALDALTGPLEEDSERVISVRVPPPPVREASVRQDSLLAASKVGSIAEGDTTEQTPSVQFETKRIKRKSAFQTGHPIITTAGMDDSDREKRNLRESYLDIFKDLPTDVRLVIQPGAIHYHGQTATVDATWKYDVVGYPTRRSRPYEAYVPKNIKLQMRRVGDDWLVSNFRGLVNQLKTDVVSR